MAGVAVGGVGGDGAVSVGFHRRVGLRWSVSGLILAWGGSVRVGSDRSEFEHVRIGSIVIRCYEFDRMLAFWRQALRYEPRDRPSDDWAVLRDPLGMRPNVSLDRAPHPRTGRRSWLHLDLYTTEQETEVERLIGIGAKRYPWRYKSGDDFVVLEDPDGNLFCVVQLPAST